VQKRQLIEIKTGFGWDVQKQAAAHTARDEK